MKLEQIQEKALQNNRFEAKVYTTTFVADFCLLGILFALLMPLILFWAGSGDWRTGVDGLDMVLMVIMCSLFFMGGWMIWWMLQIKDDVVVFTSEGMSYKGSNKMLKKRLFDLQWGEISTIKIDDCEIKIITSKGDYKWRIDRGVTIDSEGLMWLVNHFYESEVFSAEEVKKVKSEKQNQKHYFITFFIYFCFYFFCLTQEGTICNTFIDFPEVRVTIWEFWFLIPIFAGCLFLIDFGITKYFNREIKLWTKSRLLFYCRPYLCACFAFCLWHGPMTLLYFNNKYADKRVTINRVVEVKSFDEYEYRHRGHTQEKYYIGVSDVQISSIFCWLEVPYDDYKTYEEDDLLKLRIYEGLFGFWVVEIAEKIEQ